MKTKILFIHGLEGSPNGFKAQYLRNQAEFEVRCDAMPTHDYNKCLEIQANAVSEFKPDCIVGSSFGGALAFSLVEEGAWNGPTLLIAPAQRYFYRDTKAHMVLAELVKKGFPVIDASDEAWSAVRRSVSWPDNGGRLIVVHGSHDSVIPIEDSKQLIEGSKNVNTSKLIVFDDDHALNKSLVESDELRSIVQSVIAE